MAVTLGMGEFIAVVAGWVLYIPLVIFTIIILKFTPAMTFFKAWLGKKPVFHVAGRNQLGSFVAGKVTEPGWADVKGEPVSMSEGSSLLDAKSKIPIFFMFDEFAFTIPREYAAIIHELREAGFVINNFKDYEKLIRLTSDESYINSYIESIENPEEKERIRSALLQLKEQIGEKKVELTPFKTYKLHSLGNMFPNNISPTNVRAKMVNQEARLRKKHQLGDDMKKWLLVGGITMFILAIAAGLLFRLVKAPEMPACPSCVCQLAKAGLEVLTNATTTAASSPESISGITNLIP